MSLRLCHKEIMKALHQNMDIVPQLLLQPGRGLYPPFQSWRASSILIFGSASRKLSWDHEAWKDILQDSDHPVQETQV